MTAASDQLRIVLTGGPGGGKTTAADLFRREIGDEVIVVPESATILFAGGFPRTDEPEAAGPPSGPSTTCSATSKTSRPRCTPTACCSATGGPSTGPPTGPTEPMAPTGFFEAMGTTFAADLGRYDVVIFFETAAVGGLSVETGNRYRTESNAQAVALDARLRALWSSHPNFHLVPHHPSFLHKINEGLAILQQIVAEHAADPTRHRNHHRS
jgi:hypothetical protein